MTGNRGAFAALAASVGVELAPTDHPRLAVYFGEFVDAVHQIGDFVGRGDGGGGFEPSWPDSDFRWKTNNE